MEFIACLDTVILPSLSLPIEANQDIQFWAFSRCVLPALLSQSGAKARGAHKAWARSVSDRLAGAGNLEGRYFPDLQLEPAGWKQMVMPR